MEDILREKRNTNKCMKVGKCRLYWESYNIKSRLLLDACERIERAKNLRANSGQILKIFDSYMKNI